MTPRNKKRWRAVMSAVVALACLFFACALLLAAACFGIEAGDSVANSPKTVALDRAGAIAVGACLVLK